MFQQYAYCPIKEGIEQEESKYNVDKSVGSYQKVKLAKSKGKYVVVVVVDVGATVVVVVVGAIVVVDVAITGAKKLYLLNYLSSQKTSSPLLLL